jgi:hypothetical protein
MGFFAYILLLIGITAVVSFVAAAFIRSTLLSIVASAAISELIVVLYGLHAAAHSSDVYDVLLAVNITWTVCTPVFIGAAVGFTFLARRLYKKHS